MFAALPNLRRRLRLFSLLAGLSLVTGCLEFEQEIVLEPDGSGRTVVRYAVQAGDVNSNPALAGLLLDRDKIIEHYSGRPGLRLEGVDVSDQGKMRLVRLHIAFDDVAALSDEVIAYSWGVEGLQRVFRIHVQKKQFRQPTSKMQPALVQALQGNGFRFKARLPAKIVETNAEKAEWSSAEWFVPLGFFADSSETSRMLYAKIETSTWDAVKGWFAGLFGP
jgi:hypothetical protein